MNPENRKILALALDRAGQTDEAIRVLREGIDTGEVPDSSDPALLAKCYRSRGQHKLADFWWHRAAAREAISGSDDENSVDWDERIYAEVRVLFDDGS